jgi:hypothetical protein
LSASSWLITTWSSIDFTDLARDRQVFVMVHGWKPSPLWNELKNLAHSNGFCVEA